MKFVYKIHSGYDGFTPSRIPERLTSGKFLMLGWNRYIDAVEKGREVWVYFHGPHKFVPGVYAAGFVHGVDYAKRRVKLRVRKHSILEPLTDPATSARIGEVVKQWYRQVFVLPEELEPIPECDVATLAESCKTQNCTSCPIWQSLPIVHRDAHKHPDRLSAEFRAFVPAYWVIPSRCYLSSGVIAAPIKRTSEIFYRFKFGEATLGFPLALGMYEALRRRGLLDFDRIVPIPLSLGKAKRGELHRTLLLARELEELVGAEVTELLKLKANVSKRWLLSAGFTQAQFEAKYYEALEVMPEKNSPGRILLVDDVCTRGSTLTCAFQRIRAIYPELEIVGATAGQMILKQVVADENQLTSTHQESG